MSVPSICDCMGKEIYSAHRFQNLKQAGKLKAVRKLSVQDCSVPVSSASCTLSIFRISFVNSAIRTRQNTKKKIACEY